MKLWGMIVAFLYVLILIVLFPPMVAVMADLPEPISKLWQSILNGYGNGNIQFDITTWCILATAFIAQGALLTIPVDISENRPVTKRSIVPLVLATSFTTMVLVFGAVTALSEVFKSEIPNFWLVLTIYGSVWVFWAIIFFRRCKKSEPLNFIERQCRWLYRGSILELLIAVPSHIYVRQRHECCAGIGTAMGISCGIAVMLFSFGPGVFFLFKERIERKIGKNPMK